MDEEAEVRKGGCMSKSDLVGIPLEDLIACISLAIILGGKLDSKSKSFPDDVFDLTEKIVMKTCRSALIKKRGDNEQV